MVEYTQSGVYTQSSLYMVETYTVGSRRGRTHGGDIDMME